MNFVDLIEFIIAREEREETKHFKDNASDPPQIHLVSIIAISKQALRSSVPPRRDILGVGLLRVNAATGTEVSELYLVLHQQNVLSKGRGQKI